MGATTTAIIDLREEMGAVAQLPPPVTTTLYGIEQALACLLDTEDMVPPEQEAAFAADLCDALTAAVEKRDRVGQFIAHCEAQAALAKQESERLLRMAGRFERAVSRVEGYVTATIINLGLDRKGKYKKLSGTTAAFALRRNPPSVTIADEAAVPVAYKSVSITLPAQLWEDMLDSLDLEFRGRVLDAVKRPDSAVSKTLIKAAIEDAVPDWKEQIKTKPMVFAPLVPGAAIAAGGFKLVRE